MSFSKNSTATLDFLTELKQAVFSTERVKRKGKNIPKPLSVELSTIKHISIPTAVILAAELHRLCLRRKSNLHLRNKNKWNRRVLTLLESLGVFELVGAKGAKTDTDPLKEVVLLKLKSGEQRNGKAVDQLQTWMCSMELGFSEKKFVFGALDEAIINCIDHGYIDLGTPPMFPYAGHRWWATSCFDPSNKSLRFFVYDQGIGIPATIPRNSHFAPYIANMLANLLGVASDSKVIETAFEIGRTRTMEAQRGKGLDKMRLAIELAGDGYIRVISGKGDVTLNATQTLKKHDHSTHIGGTLAEWSIPIVTLQEDKRDHA